MQKTPGTQPQKFVEERELRALLELLLLAGVYWSRGGSIRGLWDEKTGRLMFRATMLRGRFEKLLLAFRFDDKLTWHERERRSKPTAIDPVWEQWEQWELQHLFNPDIDITIDEQVCDFISMLYVAWHLSWFV